MQEANMTNADSSETKKLVDYVRPTICVRCKSVFEAGDTYCRRCGYMPADETRTLTLPMYPAVTRPRRKVDLESQAGTLLLHIRGVNERIPLAEVNRLVLGRVDVEKVVTPDVDLDPYGAAERGVSRAHLMLHYANRRLFATDLASANGTLLNGQRLNANQPYEVRDNDELTLGRLTISVRIHLEA
jgi:hypothetical protein